MQEQALSGELRSRMLGWRHGGFSAHNQVQVSGQDPEARKKLAGYGAIGATLRNPHCGSGAFTNKKAPRTGNQTHKSPRDHGFWPDASRELDRFSYRFTCPAPTLWGTHFAGGTITTVPLPVLPRSPVAPVSPVDPVAPVSPVDPGAPV